MKPKFLSLLSRTLLLTFIALFANFSFAAPPSSANVTEAIFRASAALACAQKSMSPCGLLQISREQLNHNLAYYRAVIQVGPGEHDVIALNRVIKESRPGVAVHSVGSFFFIHGSNAVFRGIMVLPQGGNGMGVFLAERNIDVWGIDLRNGLIPSTVTDTSFGKNWGYDVQIPDVLLATRTVRFVRALTLQGMDRIIVAGQSSGAGLTWALANAEAGLNAEDRDIKGIVTMDFPFKIAPEDATQSNLFCNLTQVYRGLVENAGIYFFNNQGTFTWANLAQTNPDGISPFDPSKTNLQFALDNAAGLSFYPAYPYHQFAVLRSDTGVALSGKYTSTDDLLSKFANSPYYQISNTMIADMFSTGCNSIDNPYDDNLAEINIPVLYVAPGGGFGAAAAYATELIGSKDVKTLTVQLEPPENAINDFGHMEEFTAVDAQKLVWQPLHQWVMQHSH